MHRKFFFLFIFIVIFVFALFTVLNAQSLDVGLKGFGGLAGGSTDDPDKSGKIGFSGGGGIGVSLYLLQFGKIHLGASTGIDFMYLTYSSTTNTTIPPTTPPTTLKSETNYSYLVIPVTIKGSYSLRDTIAITLDAGPFFAFFLDGKSKNTFNPPDPSLGLVNGEEDLNKDTTELVDVGLRLAASIELGINENLRVSPGVMFDLGFSDTSKDQPIVASSKDTFWKLDAYFVVIYNLF